MLIKRCIWLNVQILELPDPCQPVIFDHELVIGNLKPVGRKMKEINMLRYLLIILVIVDNNIGLPLKDVN